jgi:hypothetical protein
LIDFTFSKDFWSRHFKKFEISFKSVGAKDGTLPDDGRLNSLGHEQNGLDEIPRTAYKAFDYVTRRLNALSTAVKSWLKGLTFAETPLARSPDSAGATRHLK